jgi:hypothetical protein
LPNGRTVDSVAMWCDVLDLETHYVAATQLAIDRKIEERQVSRAPRELQSSSNRPDVLRLERWFRSDELALVPGSAWDRDGAGLVEGLHGPSPVCSEKAEHAPASTCGRTYVGCQSEAVTMHWGRPGLTTSRDPVPDVPHPRDRFCALAAM